MTYSYSALKVIVMRKALLKIQAFRCLQSSQLQAI